MENDYSIPELLAAFMARELNDGETLRVGVAMPDAAALLKQHGLGVGILDQHRMRFADRPGGYTRVVRLAQVRLGDAGRKAIIEFTGERDRVKGGRRRAAPVVADKRAKS